MVVGVEMARDTEYPFWPHLTIGCREVFKLIFMSRG